MTDCISCRFPLNVILNSSQLVNKKPDTYNATERVLLISNFLSTLLSGKYRSIDYSDGSGMNLLDVFEKRWIEEISRMYGGVDVREKLGLPKPTLRVSYKVRYFREGSRISTNQRRESTVFLLLIG